MVKQALQHFPVFPERPSDEYLERWHQHLNDTGYPERFENVSTSRPSETKDVRLLSGELKVPSARRMDSPLIPCPICSPDSPKFKIGRMAWFPEEHTVRFIGHDCAARHFGESYRLADRQYKLEQRCRFYKHMWSNFEPRIDGLEAFVEKLKPIAKAVQFAREHLDDNATGFADFLRGELLRTGGLIVVKEDTGVRDRGQIVFSDAVMGRVDGLAFVQRNFRPQSTLKSILDVCADIRNPLPEWAPVDGENDNAREIVGRGRRAEWMLKTLREVRDDLDAARGFLSPANLNLLERWGAHSQSPFLSFAFRWEGKAVHLRAETYLGAYYCNMAILQDFYGAPMPSGLDPALDPLTSARI